MWRMIHPNPGSFQSRNTLIRDTIRAKGQQTVTVTKVDRSEPNPAILEVPADYKVIDENPAN